MARLSNGDGTKNGNSTKSAGRAELVTASYISVQRTRSWRKTTTTWNCCSRERMSKSLLRGLEELDGRRDECERVADSRTRPNFMFRLICSFLGQIGCIPCSSQLRVCINMEILAVYGNKRHCSDSDRCRPMQFVYGRSDRIVTSVQDSIQHGNLVPLLSLKAHVCSQRWLSFPRPRCIAQRSWRSIERMVFVWWQART